MSRQYTNELAPERLAGEEKKAITLSGNLMNNGAAVTSTNQRLFLVAGSAAVAMPAVFLVAPGGA